jgi:hypothetical protein
MRPDEIREYPAAAWLAGSNFPTDQDTRDIEPFFRGLQIGHDADAIYIGIDGSWRANMKDGRVQSAKEKIGVTPNTRWLYQGFLDSRVPIFLQRFEEGHIKRYELVVIDGKVLREVKSVEESGKVRVR